VERKSPQFASYDRKFFTCFLKRGVRYPSAKSGGTVNPSYPVNYAYESGTFWLFMKNNVTLRLLVGYLQKLFK